MEFDKEMFPTKVEGYVKQKGTGAATEKVMVVKAKRESDQQGECTVRTTEPHPQSN